MTIDNLTHTYNKTNSHHSVSKDSNTQTSNLNDKIQRVATEAFPYVSYEERLRREIRSSLILEDFYQKYRPFTMKVALTDLIARVAIIFFACITIDLISKIAGK